MASRPSVPEGPKLSRVWRRLLFALTKDDEDEAGSAPLYPPKADAVLFWLVAEADRPALLPAAGGSSSKSIRPLTPPVVSGPVRDLAKAAAAAASPDSGRSLMADRRVCCRISYALGGCSFKYPGRSQGAANAYLLPKFSVVIRAEK